jgi:hypothetical protein
MERRQFLQRVSVASVVTTTTAVAGCSDDGGDGGGSTSGERAGYADYVVADWVDEGASALSVDLDLIRESEDTPTPTPAAETEDAPEDFLISFPVISLIGVAFALGGGYPRIGLGSVMEADGPGEEAHLVRGGIAVEGTFDPSAIGDSVEGAGGTETGSYGDHTLYEAENGTVVGVSENLLVSAGADEDDASLGTPTERVETLVDAAGGDVARYGDDEADYGTLVSALPSAQLTASNYTPEGGLLDSGTPSSEGGESSMGASLEDLDLDGDVKGIATSADIDEETGDGTARLALQYTGADEVDDESAIEDAVAPNGQDVSVSVDGPVAVVEGTYSN